ncbi:uncharacterized protein LOC127750439 [Frankliniella occidentalis]|uniref:Uncharacterized protein LOC127750439 n=1 Tax=Frankliniella occidentalis TaxID=133901 RepID=A0A9C6XR63_FRAOC|nr:uncharacterized protein LOC127750439 [Frankliniella occidentalis]
MAAGPQRTLIRTRSLSWSLAFVTVYFLRVWMEVSLRQTAVTRLLFQEISGITSIVLSVKFFASRVTDVIELFGQMKTIAHCLEENRAPQKQRSMSNPARISHRVAEFNSILTALHLTELIVVLDLLRSTK